MQRGVDTIMQKLKGIMRAIKRRKCKDRLVASRCKKQAESHQKHQDLIAECVKNYQNNAQYDYYMMGAYASNCSYPPANSTMSRIDFYSALFQSDQGAGDIGEVLQNDESKAIP